MLNMASDIFAIVLIVAGVTVLFAIPAIKKHKAKKEEQSNQTTNTEQ